MTVTSSYSLYIFYHHLSIDTKQIFAKNGWMSFPSLAFCFVFTCVVTSCLHMWRRCTGTVCGTSRMTPTCCVECGSTGWATTKPSRWTPTSTSRTRSVQTANQMPPPGQGQYKQPIKCHLQDKVSTNSQSNATSRTRSVQTANQMPPPGQGQYKQPIKCHLQDKVSTNSQSNATSRTRSVQTANQMPPLGQGQYKQPIKCHLQDKHQYK